MRPIKKLPAWLHLCAAYCCIGALSACQSTAQSSPQPALLVAPSAAVQTELTKIVSGALGAQVTLSSQALTQNPILIIDPPSRPRSLDAPAAQNSWQQRPNHFELYLIDGQCLLKHRQTQQQWAIEEANCAAVNSDIASPP